MQFENVLTSSAAQLLTWTIAVATMMVVSLVPSMVLFFWDVWSGRGALLVRSIALRGLGSL